MKKRSRRTRKLETALNSAASPLFLLDDRRRVVFFNSGCEALTGWKADEVTGRVCDYASSADPAAVESITGTLCPPPEVLEGREAAVPVKLAVRGGGAADRMLHFFPLADEDGNVERILGIMTPIRQPAPAAATSPVQQVHAELAALRTKLRQRFGTGTIVARSPAMLRVLEQIKVAAGSCAGVLLEGEPGTGKEHVARAIHLQSELGSRSFVPLDCRKLPRWELKQTIRRLLEAATQDAQAAPAAGLQPGTLYLANVEALPRDLQEMLVAGRDAQSGEQRERLRYMGATAGRIQDALQSESLLQSFYYLLTTIRIELPPLRRRPEDLQPLAQSLLEELNRDAEEQVAGFSDQVWKKFRQYHWPANVDELAAVVAEARSSCSGGLIHVKDLPFRFRAGLDAQAVGPAVQPPTMPLHQLLERVEADHIRAVLEQTRYNKTKAAELLGIPRPRLYRRMQALGIEDRNDQS